MVWDASCVGSKLGLNLVGHRVESMEWHKWPSCEHSCMALKLWSIPLSIVIGDVGEGFGCDALR